MDDETIAAVATAPGPAGIAVVRVSGPAAFDVGRRVAGPPPPGDAPLSAKYAHFRDGATGETIDDGIALFFRAPHGYTGEDVVELQGHGGRLPSSRLLAAALSAGARMAEPGEFTRRAFLNGKLDLARAEAVMDFIGAASERAAAAAREQLDGRLSRGADALFDAIVAVEADVEHLLDFDEGEIPGDFRDDAARRILAAAQAASKMLATWRSGAYLREGALVVICGKPNAGKSSLLNALLGRDRAIVSPVAGTTRDSIEEPMVVRGIPVRLVDTAGLRAAADGIEAEGVSRAEDLVSRADLVIEVVDATQPGIFAEGSHLGGALADATDASGAPPSAPGRIRVFNKADLLPRMELPPQAVGATGRDAALFVSARTGLGMERLVAEIGSRLDAAPAEDAAPGVSERHRACLQEAREALEAAAQALALGDEGLVVAAERLSQAAQAVGRVTGRVWSEELLDAVFGKFCVGK